MKSSEVSCLAPLSEGCLWRPVIMVHIQGHFLPLLLPPLHQRFTQLTTSVTLTHRSTIQMYCTFSTREIRLFIIPALLIVDRSKQELDSMKTEMDFL